MSGARRTASAPAIFLALLAALRAVPAGAAAGDAAKGTAPRPILITVDDLPIGLQRLHPDPADREGLRVVTQILAGLAFPDKRFLDLFGGAEVMIESPVLDEVKALIRVRAIRENILAALEARFGTVPAERVKALHTITDDARLNQLIRLAATCPDVETFVAALSAGTTPA
jgi:hypothetical protein